MRRTEKEIKEKDIINEIIDNADVCRIAVIDGEEPYIVPLNFGYHNNTLYFHSAQAGRKIDLLKKTSRVCFEIESTMQLNKAETPCKWTTKYRSVIGWGNIEIVNEFVAKKFGMDIIMKKYGAREPLEYNQEMMNRIFILKLTIDKLTGKQSGTWE